MKADTANGIDCSGTQPTSAYNCDAQGAIGVGADNGVNDGVAAACTAGAASKAPPRRATIEKRGPHTGVGRASGLLVLTLNGDRISHITRFAATSALPHLGFPRTIPW
jgi:hypothetical protein